MPNYVLVFIGGGIGSALRYGVGRVALIVVGPNFPAGTLAVNIAGCFLMGALAEWLAFRDTGIGQAARLFLTTGLLGGFTTFSAFALDTVALWERGEALTTAAYVAASVVLSVGGLVAGMLLLRPVLS